MENTISIILEGGGHRGIYSAGILDVLYENNLIADAVFGVSAGAIHGASYASGQVGRSIRYTTRFCNDKRYMGFGSLLATGDYFNEEFCYHQIPEVLDPYDNEAFEKSPVKLYIVATNVYSGQPIYHLCTSLKGNHIKWLQGSASMPLVSKPVQVDGYTLLDGGISDSIPLVAAEEKGYKKNIVILTQPEGYRKKQNSLLPLIKIVLRKFPHLLKAMENRHVHYNNALDIIERKAKNNEIILLRPSRNLGVSRTEKNPEKIQSLYELGRQDALENLEKIKNFFNSNIAGTK